MERDFGNTLSTHAMVVRHEQAAHATVSRAPRTASIVGPVDSSRRDSHIHLLLVAGVEHNRVQGKTSVARHPTRTMGMIKQAAHQRPCFSSVPGLEKRGGLYSAIEHVGLVRRAKRDLPDVLQGNAGI